MRDFFSKHIYKYMKEDSKIINISLLDKAGNVVEEY
jgi:hypothetical protein